MRISPIRKRQRVSSQNLYQSMSALRCDTFEEDFLERDRQHVDRSRVEGARLVENPFRMTARHQRQDAAAALYTCDAWRSERSVWSSTVEDQLNPPVLFAEGVEGPGNHRA